uniref:Lesion bypass phage DNA polymerase n=1 Tax=mine drainage metagenome TaxID=410659 RepID=E6QQI1_9ZZZZ
MLFHTDNNERRNLNIALGGITPKKKLVLAA